MALDAGIEASGVEPSRRNCLVAAERYGVSLVNQSVQDYLVGTSAPLHCVTMLNVLEHLPSPVTLLQQLRVALNPEGLLLVVVPNVDFTLVLGALRRALGFEDVYMLESERFSQQGFDPPIHLSSFNRASLARALSNAGLRTKLMTQAPVIRARDPLADLAKRGVRTIGAALERLTGGRLVFGYSLLAVATKEAV
jgi:hypothetical protein